MHVWKEQMSMGTSIDEASDKAFYLHMQRDMLPVWHASQLGFGSGMACRLDKPYPMDDMSSINPV